MTFITFTYHSYWGYYWHQVLMWPRDCKYSVFCYPHPYRWNPSEDVYRWKTIILWALDLFFLHVNTKCVLCILFLLIKVCNRMKISIVFKKYYLYVAKCRLKFSSFFGDFIYLFIFGCDGSSLLCVRFLLVARKQGLLWE